MSLLLNCMKICLIVTQTDQINLGVEMISQDISSSTSCRCFDTSNTSSLSLVLQMQITDQREHIWMGLLYHRVTFFTLLIQTSRFGDNRNIRLGSGSLIPMSDKDPYVFSGQPEMIKQLISWLFFLKPCRLLFHC